jgi:flagellar biogenesis protein FliO
MRWGQDVKSNAQRLLPLGILCTSVLAAVIATPLLFPQSASAAVPTDSRSAPVERAQSASAAPVSGKEKPGRADEEALAKLGFVILTIMGLGASAVWLVRKSKGLPLRKRGRGKSLEVVDLLNLGHKKSLAVVRVYDRVFVIGIGDGPLSLVTELREEEAGIDAAELAAADRAPANTAQPFRAMIQNLLRRRHHGPTSEAIARAESNPLEVPAAPRRAQRQTIAELQAMEQTREYATAGSSDDDLL